MGGEYLWFLLSMLALLGLSDGHGREHSNWSWSATEAETQPTLAGLLATTSQTDNSSLRVCTVRRCYSSILRAFTECHVSYTYTCPRPHDSADMTECCGRGQCCRNDFSSFLAHYWFVFLLCVLICVTAVFGLGRFCHWSVNYCRRTHFNCHFRRTSTLQTCSSISDDQQVIEDNPPSYTDAVSSEPNLTTGATLRLNVYIEAEQGINHSSGEDEAPPPAYESDCVQVTLELPPAYSQNTAETAV